MERELRRQNVFFTEPYALKQGQKVYFSPPDGEDGLYLQRPHKVSLDATGKLAGTSQHDYHAFPQGQWIVIIQAP